MEDERSIELDCLTAIFPEIILDPKNPFSATIDLQVNPAKPVKVLFPAAADGILPTPPQSDTSSQQDGEPARDIEGRSKFESHNLSYLPSLRLRITLPEGYPEEKPPQFELSTDPAWLSRAHLDELEAYGTTMWEDAGRAVVAYGYIDFLQQSAENAFGFAEEGNVLAIPQDHKISLLDLDIRATQAAFAKEHFDCGVCLEPKKGLVCHRMIDCGHVFCVECLQDYYNNAIKEGDLTFVRCLDPGCAKKRTEAQAATKKTRKVRTQLSPSELLQIPLEPEVVKRYVMLKRKATLESDKNTIYCPRSWCQGAARSKKSRKPVGTEAGEGSDEEAENGEQPPSKAPKFLSGNDLLSVCEDCSFAFCSRCYQGWHGEFTVCIPRSETGELTEEDKASLAYLKKHSTPCPTCNAPAQKTHGCNHMICFTCRSHFCYLCSSWLSPSNPYGHYNKKGAPCHMRLWEGEEGDGDGHWFGEREQEDPHEDIVVVPQDAPEVVVAPEPVAAEAVVQPPLEVLQREGPLVLRINQLPPQPAPVPVPVAPNAGRNAGRNRQAPPRQGQRGNGRGAPQGRGGVARNRVPRHQPPPQPDPQGQEAAQQAWVQMFVQMAMNDEEDQLDSDDEADGRQWEIPVR